MAPLLADDGSNENSDPLSLPPTSISSLVIFSITFLLGFPGNALVIWVIAAKMKPTVNTVWFLHLAMADLLCCLSLPFAIAQLALYQRWPFGWFLCKVIPSAVILNMFASVFLLTTISLDRCLLVTRPVWCQNHRTVRVASRICCGVWILAFAMCCPAIFYRETLEDEFGNIRCVNHWDAEEHNAYEWLDYEFAGETIPAERPSPASEGIYEDIFTGGILDPYPASHTVNATQSSPPVPLRASHQRETDVWMKAVTLPPSGLHGFPRIRVSTPTAGIFPLDDQSASHGPTEGTFHDDLLQPQPPGALVSVTVTRTVFGFLLPFAVMATCYLLIAQKMLKKHMVRPRKKALQVILLVVGTFFLSWAPYHVSGVLFLLTPPQTAFHQALLWWDSVSVALAYANSCLNPLLYVFVGQKFRETARQTLQKILEGALIEPSSPACSQDKSRATTAEHDMDTSVL